MSVHPPRLTLHADTAAELMSANPISLRRTATVKQAVRLMTDHAFSAAPVIDAGGRPIGVVSVSDILLHDRESAGGALNGQTRVEDIMTPAVCSVRSTALVGEVVQTMLTCRVHHLFVTDEHGTLVGVISMGDVLRKL